jgi:RNA polymerase primary sigma factor
MMETIARDKARGTKSFREGTRLRNEFENGGNRAEAAPDQRPSLTESTRAREHLDTSERSSLKLYLQEIGRTPLLRPEQEVELAGRIQNGEKAARDLMIKSNLRLVVKIAHDYKDFGLPLLDLISEGNIGLIKAVERFDPQKGGKLSTYAAWWIKQSIKRALANQSKTIRLPVHLVDKISKMRKTAMALTEEFGREPTDEEIAEEMHMPVNKVAHLKSVSVRPTSLNAPVGDESGSTEFGEIVGDDNAPTPFEQLSDKSLQLDVNQMISDLDEREAKIIRLRFGLEGETPLTLEEVGDLFGITRERVRQLQNMALSKMRKIMYGKERQRTIEEIEENQREQKRMEVIREFFEEKEREKIAG